MTVSSQPRRSTWSFAGFLADPRVDRTVAIIAILPTVYLIYWRLRQGTLDIVRINLILQSLLLIATTVARRPPATTAEPAARSRVPRQQHLASGHTP